MPQTTMTACGFLFLVACTTGAEPRTGGPPPPRRTAEAPPTAGAVEPDKPTMSRDPESSAPPEACLGVADTGIWSDLDDQVQLALPSRLARSQVEGVVSVDGGTLILYVDGWPTKAYPLTGEVVVTIDGQSLGLRAGDAAELRDLFDASNLRRLAAGEVPPPGDRDGDGLPDPLDLLIGAKKTAIEAGAYGGQYIRLSYPGGDVPRDMGVCTDVVIRALRNAGLDLQVEVHRDIKKSRRSYPMVKGNGDTNIDHRRVRTLLPWFKRHAAAHTIALDDRDDPLRPGDIVFMDTLSRPGPDHIGVVSDTLGDSGLPLVINAWTDGYVTQEMDLLGWVPITHRFRL
jgi:uncharacterized protein